jgi:hypothetical protein
MTAETLAFQAKVTLWVTATPVPDSAIVAGEFVALLAIVTVPLTAPAFVGENSTVTVADWFGANTSPEVRPLALKPVPDELTLEMVTLAFPLLVTVALNVLLLPTFTFPNARLEVLSPSSLVAVTPVPLNAMTVGEFGALLTIVTEPLTEPAEVGPNTTLNVVLLPAATDKGALIPVILKPVPATATEEMAREAFPPFERVIVCELLVPVLTFPKLALPGVAVICACVAVPLKEIVIDGFEALLTIEIVPLLLPELVGANCALKVVLWPARTVIGAVSPLMLKPAPVAAACEIVTLAEPEFVKVMDWLPVLPTFTDPKFTIGGLAPS